MNAELLQNGFIWLNAIGWRLHAWILCPRCKRGVIISYVSVGFFCLLVHGKTCVHSLLRLLLPWLMLYVDFRALWKWIDEPLSVKPFSALWKWIDEPLSVKPFSGCISTSFNYMAIKEEEQGMEDLEVAMHQLIHQHSLQNTTLRESIDQSRKEALAVAVKVSNLLVDSVNGGVQEVFMNEKQIEMEARSFAATVQKYAKQTNQWLTMFSALDATLKEIGDFENWVTVMEHDCEDISKAFGFISSSREKSK